MTAQRTVVPSNRVVGERLRTWWAGLTSIGTWPIEVSVSTELRVDEAAAAIRSGLTSPLKGWLAAFRPGNWTLFHVTGSVRSGAVCLVPRDGVGNSWYPSFTGEIVPAGNGCMLRGEIAFDPAADLFLRVWVWLFAMFMLSAEIGTVGLFISGRSHSFLVAMFFLIVLPLMLVAALSIRWIGIRLALRSARALVAWLQTRLASDQTTAVGARPPA